MRETPILRRRVLVVEDDPDSRDLLTTALDGEGYEVQEVPDGLAALEALEAWRPHLILLDLAMPVLDGWAFRAEQLARPDWAPIPTVVLTAGENLRHRADALRARAILTKPFDLGALLGLVAALTGAPAGVAAGGGGSFSRN